MEMSFLQWLEAGGYVVAIIGGVAGAAVFIGKWMTRFASFRYPVNSEQGLNILHSEVSRVEKAKPVGMSAIVPDGAELLVKLAMAPHHPEPEAVGPGGMRMAGSAGMAAWFYTVAPAPLNWRGRKYQAGAGDVGPTQNFVAKGGEAELSIQFERVGEVVISVYERGASSPTWTKTIHVVPSPG